ncbi:MAG: ABC transporter permease [Vicinamibacterales bacterium]
MDTLLHDMRLALRALLRAPVAAGLAVACLSLGIGVNAAIFSIVQGTVLQPLPFKDAERLVTVWSTQPEGRVRRGAVSYQDFVDFRAGSRALDAMAGLHLRSLTFSDTDEPERVAGAAVSWPLFSMLGVTPALGRDFTAADDRPGAAPVLILSDELWRRRYNADPGIVGRQVTVNAAPYTVVGVLPPRVKFPFQQVAWVPLAPLLTTALRQERDLLVVAHVAPGRSTTDAQEELAAISSRLAQAYEQNAGWSALLRPLSEYFIPGEVRLVTFTAMGAVTLVLLIACANVANLLLARATARAREMSVRAALGAGQGRIVRQLLTESVLLGLLSAPAGIALTYAGVGAVTAGMRMDDVPYLIAFGVSPATLVYAVIVAAMTGVVFGLAPAIHAARADLAGVLREGGRTGDAGVRNRARNVLVVAEVAVSIVLLVGAALFVRSFLNLQRADAGFDVAPITTVRFFMPGEPYAAAGTKARRVADVLERIESVPGVQAAGASNLIPLDGGGGESRVEFPGRPAERGREPSLFYAGVTAHYLDVLGLAPLRGRLFTAQEAATRSRVAVVNVSMARTLLATAGEAARLTRVSQGRLAGARELDGLDPIGRQFRLLDEPGGETFTVIGVVADVLVDEVGGDGVSPAAFVPYPYQETPNTGVIVRASGDPTAVTAGLRAAIRASDPSLPVFSASSMDEIRRGGFWQFQLFGNMFGAFGAMALVLALVGVYGVLSYSVSQRTQEFGVRMALGAEPSDVRRMLIRQGLTLAAWGIGLGVIGAFGITRVIGSLLYNVTATDPLSFGGVVLVLLAVAALAAYFPARKATRVDPAVALRTG